MNGHMAYLIGMFVGIFVLFVPFVLIMEKVEARRDRERAEKQPKDRYFEVSFSSKGGITRAIPESEYADQHRVTGTFRIKD